jgi:hypothetical protein
MALGDDFFVQTFTTTLQKYEKQLVDNVLKDHPALELFKASAKSITGRGLVVPLRAANLSATGYSDRGIHADANNSKDSVPFSTGVSGDIMGSAVYNWADTVVTPFRVKHRDIIQNAGPEQIVNLVEEYVKAAAADHGDFIVAQLHKSAADFAAGDIMPLDMVFGNAASDDYFDGVNAAWTPVGGINPNDSGKSYWQSTRQELPATGNDSVDIVAAFRAITNDIYRNSRKRPDVVLAGFDIYEELEAFLQDKGQYTHPQGPAGSAETRFQKILFGGLEVRLDPDLDDDRAWFLNKASLRFGYCAGEFMKTFPAQPIEGTLDTVVPMASSLVFGTTERRANGLLIRTYA